MGRLKTLAMVVVLLATGAVGALIISDKGARAQQGGVYEYAWLVGVPRLESYEIDVSRWGATNEDKDLLKARVFAYETGSTSFNKQVNSLRRMNELAAQGWEPVDVESGLLRRLK